MEREITCPSGLKGTLRNLKMRDIQAISQVQSNKRGDFIRRVLELCWLGVSESGPYIGEFKWLEALLGDAFYAFVAARILTYGELYECAAVCPRCSEASPQTINLTELETLWLPEKSKQLFRDKQLFKVNVADREVGFRLLTLHDERGIGQLMENRELAYMLAALVQRTVTLDGKAVIPSEAQAFYEPLDAGLIQDFDHFIETQLECGLDTNIDCKCRCGVRFRQRLPLTDGFFSTAARPEKEQRFTLIG